ncbi:hypothetical protein B0T14DRAFT_563234 [Immersiella caudata]|uniref:Uncharacterized protein n=1 Tax=Immersiella caudata TaxID=314043 RepID=A0AA40C6X6_9PEZI|nr:hypothetical protein B0T14DRAFT_563234 [Immersiella caudata]
MRSAVALSLLAVPGTLAAPQAGPIVVDAVFGILTGLGPTATPFCIDFLNQPRTATRTTKTTSTPVTTVLTTTFTSTLSAATNCDATTTTTVIDYPPPPPPFRPSPVLVIKRAEAAEAVTVTVPPALAIFQPSIVSSASLRLGTVVFPAPRNGWKRWVAIGFIVLLVEVLAESQNLLLYRPLRRIQLRQHHG